jgi:DNA-binding Lrp family transcriptional regulator
VTPTPKIRSRKLGAAIALDEFDKRLLNQMQGSFPIVERPYAAVAQELGVGEDVVLRRVQELIDERAAVLEALTALRRAGADAIITYYAKDAADWLHD